LLGDKLTAFAPHTTGIPINQNKDMEVIKQYFDIATLIDNFSNFEDILETYYKISKTEIGYRGLECSCEQVLEDTIKATICIGTRGKIMKEDFTFYLKGTRDIVNHIYSMNFNMEIASSMAPKIIYMATCLLTKKYIKLPKDKESLRKENLIQDDLKLMKNFRKFRDDGYLYLVIADRLLSEYRKKYSI